MPEFNKEHLRQFREQQEASRTSNEQIQQLKRFYGVSTLEELVLIQAQHVERLQAKIPPLRDEQPRKSRFA